MGKDETDRKMGTGHGKVGGGEGESREVLSACLGAKQGRTKIVFVQYIRILLFRSWNLLYHAVMVLVNLCKLADCK